MDEQSIQKEDLVAAGQTPCLGVVLVNAETLLGAGIGSQL